MNSLLFFLTLVSVLFASIKSFYNEIYIIRHGETDWNKEGRIQGHTDIPLNQTGKYQALQLKEALCAIPFSRVFSSDLSRAYATAEIVLNSRSMPITRVPELRERVMGNWEGRLMTEFVKLLSESSDLDNLSKEQYLLYKFDETIESYADVYQRVYDFVRLVAKQPLDFPILLVSHGGVLRAILYHLDFRLGFRWYVGNGAYIKLRICNGEWSIVESSGIYCIPTQEAVMSF